MLQLGHALSQTFDSQRATPDVHIVAANTATCADSYFCIGVFDTLRAYPLQLIKSTDSSGASKGACNV